MYSLAHQRPLRFDQSDTIIFIVFGAIIAPFVSSFVDVGLVTAIGWGHGSYASLWRMRFFSNVLASLTLVPVIVTALALRPSTLRPAPPRRYAEAGALLFGLVLVSATVFVGNTLGSHAVPALIYAPVPFLLWAALRLGPLGTSVSLLTVALFAIWGAIHGRGPFVAALPEDSAFSIQLFLIVLSITLLLLSAVMEQNGQTARALRHSEERLRLTIDAAKIGTWEWLIQPNTSSWSGQSKQLFGLGASHSDFAFERFQEQLHPDDRDAVTQAVHRAMKDRLPYGSSSSCSAAGRWQSGGVGKR